MQYGPVDVLAVAIGEPRFDGSVVAELSKLAEAGVIRVLDAMLVVKTAEGEAYGVDIEDLPAEEKAALGFIETGTRGLFSADDSAAFMEGLVPGSALVALAIENAWAVPLINAIIATGAEIALHTRIPAVLVEEALTAAAAE